MSVQYKIILNRTDRRRKFNYRWKGFQIPVSPPQGFIYTPLGGVNTPPSFVQHPPKIFLS